MISSYNSNGCTTQQAPSMHSTTSTRFPSRFNDQGLPNLLLLSNNDKPVVASTKISDVTTILMEKDRKSAGTYC